jgi:hypothetical protein
MLLVRLIKYFGLFAVALIGRQRIKRLSFLFNFIEAEIPPKNNSLMSLNSEIG